LHSSPTLNNVSIIGNKAIGNWSKGGGINCYNSSPTLKNVTIMGNKATGEYAKGGGIGCFDYSTPHLVNVQIIDNISADNGGGIYCWGSSPCLENVTITGNSAENNGGGIYCWYISLPILLNSIVSDNTGNYGIYVGSGHPSIEFCNFYNNESGNFYGVNDSLGVNVTVNSNEDSCDVYYNIQMDPCFVDTSNNNYHLTEDSPCIDAGDPNSPLDPDWTVADMGAFYYAQVQMVDMLYFTANFVAGHVLISWCTATETDVEGFNIYRHTVPEVSTAQQINISLIPGAGTTTEPHEYEFLDQEANIDSTYYYWLEVVTWGGLSSFLGPIIYELNFCVEDEVYSNELKNYKIYPNPVNLNNEINISFILKKRRKVEIELFNIKGRLVAKVADEEMAQGLHRIQRKINDLATGIYFIKLDLDGKKNAIRKIVKLE